MSRIIMEHQTINGETIIGRYSGHRKTFGRDANVEKNPIFQTDKGNLYIGCAGNNYVLVDEETLMRIGELEEMYKTNLTWFVMTNGYVATHITGVTLYLHQLLTGFYGNGKGIMTGSIDHIDRNKLNNRLSNLRIATKEEQHSNAKGIIPGTKRNRKCNAALFPPGLTEEMIPPYVIYYPDRYMTNEGFKFREFFCINNHPNQHKPLYTSKSNKVSILEKLEEAKRIVAELDKREITDVNEVKPKQEVEEGYTLPQYFYLTKQHGKDAVCFERRYDDGGKRRVGIKVTIKEGETIQQAVERILEQVDVETGEKKKKSVKLNNSNNSNNSTNDTENEIVLPKGFSLTHDKKADKQCLSFQRSVAGKRYVGRTFICEGENITDTLARLTTSIKERYGLDKGNISVI